MVGERGLNMSRNRVWWLLSAVVLAAVVVWPSLGHSGEAAAGKNMIDAVYDQVGNSAANWTGRLQGVGLRLFWYLVVISMVWTFGSHALGGSFNFGALFHEFIRFTCFVGFWKWSLDSGFALLNAIVTSFFNLGGNMSGANIKASELFWLALSVYAKVMGATKDLGWVDQFIMAILALFILIIVGVVAANLLVLLCAGKILCYGGIFYFGFGGSRWTSDIAINYYKSVLGIAINIFATLLLIEIASSVFAGLAANLAAPDSVLGFQNVAAVVVAIVIMAMLVMRVPPMLAGIVSAPTGSIDGIGIGHAMRTMQNMAGGMVDTARDMARGGSNAATAIASAHEKMNQNVEMGIGFVRGEGGASSLMRGLETGKILGSAMYKNFQNGGPQGGVSRMIDDWIARDGAAPKPKAPADGGGAVAPGASGSAGSPPALPSGYVSSVPADASAVSAFTGGVIGGAVVQGAQEKGGAQGGSADGGGGAGVAGASKPPGAGSLAGVGVAAASPNVQGAAPGAGDSGSGVAAHDGLPSAAERSQSVQASIDENVNRLGDAKNRLD